MRLCTLRQTQKFLLREGVPPGPSDPDGDTPFSLGRLNLIKRRTRIPYRKRSPVTLDDWLLLERKQEGLQRSFTAELQQRFRLYKSHQIINFIPFLLLMLAFGSLVLAIFRGSGGTRPSAEWVFFVYLFWTSCLGGLGAFGFLAVNSLAIQNDLTFDISNEMLVAMRVMLGALFGCIVSLPFGFQYFKDFANWVIVGGDLDSVRGVFLLLPFLLGFSTTLLMTVLNRMVTGVETVFGIDRGEAQADAASRQASPPPAERSRRFRSARTRSIIGGRDAAAGGEERQAGAGVGHAAPGSCHVLLAKT